MWLSYNNGVGWFEYYHWRAGTLERAVFFDPEFLSSLLEDEESDEEKQRLEQIWQNGELVIGEMAPYLDGQSEAFDVATYYRFPGWDK